MDTYPDNNTSPSIDDGIPDDENRVSNVETHTNNEAFDTMDINQSGNAENKSGNFIVGPSEAVEQQPLQDVNDRLPHFSMQTVLMPGSYQPNIHYSLPNVPIDQQMPHVSTHTMNETVGAGSSLVYHSSEQQPYPETQIQPPSFPIQVLQIPRHCNESDHFQSGLHADQQHLMQSQLPNELVSVPYSYQAIEQQSFQKVGDHLPNITMQGVPMPASYQPNIHHLSSNVPIDQQLSHVPAPIMNEIVDGSSSSSVYQFSEQQPHPEIYIQPPSFPIHVLQTPHCNQSDHSQSGLIADQQHLLQSQLSNELVFVPYGHVEQPYWTVTNYPPIVMTGMLQTPVSYQLGYYPPNMQTLQTQPLNISTSAETATALAGPSEGNTAIYNETSTCLPNEVLQQSVSISEYRPSVQDLENTHQNAFLQEQDEEQGSMEHYEESEVQCDLNEELSEQQNVLTLTDDRELEQNYIVPHKPHECNVCHAKFSHKGHFNVHMRVHTGEKPYQCNVCHAKFSRTSHLNDHMQIHTGEKPYECNLCHKKFPHSWNLKIHLRIHTGEKPHQCPTCGQKFSSSWNLKGHMRIHTGEKPYQCTLCDQKCRHLDHLKIHMRIHTGEKPYQCNICGKKCTRSSNLKSHIKRFHS